MGLRQIGKHQVDALHTYHVQVDGATAHDGDHRLAISLGAASHTHRRLTGGRLLVHIALARYDQVDIAHALVKPHEVEHRLHARTQLRPERQQRGTQATCGAGAGHTEHRAKCPSALGHAQQPLSSQPR